MTYYHNAHGVGIDTKDPAFDSYTGEIPADIGGVPCDTNLPAVYLFSNARDGDGVAYAMCEDGTVLASHWCSHWGYMLHDLYHTKLDRYSDHYPDGYRLIVCGPGETPPPDVVDRNRALREAAGAV